MIAKERTIPLKIRICEALLRRLPKDHPSRTEIQIELNKRWAGYWGEQSLDYYLNLLDQKKYLILHDLNLPIGNFVFQIDTLLLSSNFILIIEVKNIAGTLFFDQVSHQLIRTTSNSIEESFADPISQVKLHKYQLELFFKKHRLQNIPIEWVVVISNKSSILKTNPGREHIFRQVFKSLHLIQRIQELEKVYSQDILSKKELRKISKLFIKSNTPPTNYFLEKYQISKKQLLSGIHCPSCSAIHMDRKKKWICSKCNTHSKDAHIESLYDYFLLIDTKISNRQFCEWAKLQSRHIGSKLLVSANFPIIGTTKDRVYCAPDDFFK